MYHSPTRYIPLLLAAPLLLLFPWLSGAAPLPIERLHLVTDDLHHPIEVEIAATPAAHRTGLQGRQELAPDRGMLFDLGGVRPIAMWMRGTPLSLDMLFIDEDGTIVQITAEAEPFSETLIHSPGPVRAVLELPGGRAAELGVTPGDRVVHTLFEPAAALPE